MKYLLIKGPISAGKTTLAYTITKELTKKRVAALCCSFDTFREEYNLSKPTYNNKKEGIKLFIPYLNSLIDKNIFPVVESVFYEQDLADLLVSNLPEGKIITLKPSLSTCLRFNAKRKFPRSEVALRKTYDEHKEGVETVDVWEVVLEILKSVVAS